MSAGRVQCIKVELWAFKLSGEYSRRQHYIHSFRGGLPTSGTAFTLFILSCMPALQQLVGLTVEKLHSPVDGDGSDTYHGNRHGICHAAAEKLHSSPSPLPAAPDGQALRFFITSMGRANDLARLFEHGLGFRTRSSIVRFHAGPVGGPSQCYTFHPVRRFELWIP